MKRNQIAASLVTGSMTLILACALKPAGALYSSNNSAQNTKAQGLPAQIETSKPVYLAQSRSENENEIEGTWKITEGKNLEGDKYTGTAEIEAQSSADNLYSFSWKTSEGEYTGLGFLEDDHLFIGWAPEGEVYGVLLYEIQSDGTLEGRWTYNTAPDGKVGRETATGGRKDKIEGEYEINGKDIGGEYNGRMNISRSGDTYQLSWTVDDKTYRGVGLRSGDWLVVGWGPKDDFGVLDYKINGSKATGRWALPGRSQLGVDKITRER